MPPPNSSGFIVVECQTAPNNNNKCVCVPRSWVKCELREKKVAIAYPAEDENRIAARITNNEPASETWSLYIGEIKYEAESYQDAVVGFLKKNSKEIEEKSCKKSVENAEQKKNAKEIEEKSYKKSNEIVLGSRKKKVEEEICTSEYFCVDPGATPKDSLKVRIVLPKLKTENIKSKSLKKYFKEHSKNKIHKSKHKNGEKRALKENTPRKKKDSTSDSADSGVVEGSSRFEPKSSENSTEKTLETKVEDLIIDSLRQTLKELNDNSGKSQKTISESLDIEQDGEIDLSNSNLSPDDKRAVLMMQINQRQTRGYIKSVLIHMKTLYLKYIEDKRTLNALILKSKSQPPPTVPEKTAEPNEFEDENSNDMETLRFDDDENSDGDEEKSATQEDNILMDELQNSLKQKKIKIHDQDCDFEICMDEEESTSLPSKKSFLEPVKPKRRLKRDRCQENSTWTLKHPGPGNGLIPFGRSNQVYINAKGFEKVKNHSTSAIMCARLLCREIFKPEALRTCTLTGRRGYTGKNPDLVRPPIHSGALNDIINYSFSYGAKTGDPTVRQTLINSIRSVLNNSRKVVKKQKSQ